MKKSLLIAEDEETTLSLLRKVFDRPDLVPPDDELRAEHSERVHHLLECGVDVFLIETINSIREAGIKVEVKKMRKILADLGCAVDEKTKVVKFPPRVVETYVGKAPREYLSDRRLGATTSP